MNNSSISRIGFACLVATAAVQALVHAAASRMPPLAMRTATATAGSKLVLMDITRLQVWSRPALPAPHR